MKTVRTVLDELTEDIIKNEPASHKDSNTLTLENTIETKSYIQQNETFFETTREKLMSYISENDYHQQEFAWKHLPFNELETTGDIALEFQRNSHIISNLCYGFLGGISLMQLVLTNALVKGSKHEFVSFIQLYSQFGYVPLISFSLLTTSCLVFSFDRIDPVTIKQTMKQEGRIFINNWTLFILYFVTFVLSIFCTKYDEMIAHYPDNKNILESSDNLWFWKNLNLWRCIFGIIGWFFVCICRPNDLLEHHLHALKKETKLEIKTANQIE